jgi:predicted nuclease of predicted toxin-antitoxin system
VKFKADENLPVEVVALFRTAGHDAFTVVEQRLQGQADSRIIDICRREDRVLLTLDLDFADVRTYPPQQCPGIVVLRVRYQDRPHLLAVFQRILPLFDKEQIAQHLWIVDETQVRIRGE